MKGRSTYRVKKNNRKFIHATDAHKMHCGHEIQFSLLKEKDDVVRAGKESRASKRVSTTLPYTAFFKCKRKSVSKVTLENVYIVDGVCFMHHVNVKLHFLNTTEANYNHIKLMKS